MIVSIDQNCHSLWDVLPKLHALAAAGHPTTHFIEDIDAAFTALGADVEAGELRIARERFHHSGGADWGAALFYTEFLGRLPVEVRNWEPFTGVKTGALARQLGRNVDDLYDEFSPGDNWQLIGPSFVGDREHHRVIGDLSVRETAPFVHELLAKARADMERAFPAAASRQRLAEWFAREEALVGRLLADLADAPLVELYRRWLGEHLKGGPADRLVGIDLTSQLFAAADPLVDADALANVFLAQYERAATLYNEAVEESGVALRPLRVKEGELPLFATFEHAGHLVRTGMYLRDAALHVGAQVFTLETGARLPRRALSAGGVRAVAGKAVLLILQVRLGERGWPLALPYRGSMYMPAAHLLARKLGDAGLLPGEMKPIVRVRLRLLDRLRELDTPIRPPAHLAAAMGCQEVPARVLGEAWADLAAQAAARLRAFRDGPQREGWLRESSPEAFAEIGALDGRRRELAARNPKDPELREVWKRIRAIQEGLLDRLVRQIDRDVQVADLDYYDTRGAGLPWCVALGGAALYDEVIARAEVYEEDVPRAAEHGRDG